MQSFLYEYLSNEIYTEYKKIFSARKNIEELWKKDKKPIVYFMLGFSSFLIMMILIICNFNFVFIIFAFIIFFVSMMLLKKNINFIHQILYSQENMMLSRTKTILIKHGIDIKCERTLENLLVENANLNEELKTKQKNLFSGVFKLFNIFLIAPIAFLISLGFRIETDALGVNTAEYVEKISTLVTVVGIVGIVIVFSISYMYASILSDEVFNFIFPSSNRIKVFNKYVSTLTYNSVFTNQKVI